MMVSDAAADDHDVDEDADEDAGEDDDGSVIRTALVIRLIVSL